MIRTNYIGVSFPCIFVARSLTEKYRDLPRLPRAHEYIRIDVRRGWTWLDGRPLSPITDSLFSLLYFFLQFCGALRMSDDDRDIDIESDVSGTHGRA